MTVDVVSLNPAPFLHAVVYSLCQPFDVAFLVTSTSTYVNIVFPTSFCRL